jgi:glutaredoxin-related protein
MSFVVVLLIVVFGVVVVSLFPGGFSARVVQVLQAEGVDFSSVNVLDYPEIRDGGK